MRRALALGLGLAATVAAEPGPPGRLGDPARGGPTGQRVVVRWDSAVEMAFVGLSAGEYDMGSELGRGDGDEHPQRRVRVGAFAIGEHEVSRAQWAAVVMAAQAAGDADAKGLSAAPPPAGEAQLPVTGVSWCDAVRFANALSRLEGKVAAYAVKPDCELGGAVPRDRAADGFRLPTEAEWEYAARAGTRTAYSFGDSPDSVCTPAGPSMPPKDPAPPACAAANRTIQPVCTFVRSPWGLCDLHTNAWEWVEDWYGDRYDAAESGDPSGPASGASRVLRGGAPSNWGAFARSADRMKAPPAYRNSAIGFRLALPSP